ncbi:hypothetical protein BC827DRAFT_1270319 [Russula dissimulans]|nr:hypothetical protein BC827DRAFT_1270319 [Russula dissimulans]
MQHQQVQFFPDPSLPPGLGDLEALERLKEIIKNNQHEFFRAIPRPAALAGLYRGPLPSLIPPHPEQASIYPPEKSTTTPPGLSFENSSSNFVSDTHRAHVASATQGAPLVGIQGRANVPARPGISSGSHPSPVDPRDESLSLTNGRSTSRQSPDDPSHPMSSHFRGPSAEHVLDGNGSGVTVLGSNPPSRLPPEPTFAQRDALRHDGMRDVQGNQSQLLSSLDRRQPGADDDRPIRPSVHTSERERPLPRGMRPYDRERDSERVHENERTYEQDRERGRERRWSLSDHRRLELDRRSFDNDRRPPPDGRRRPSYDRRPPQNDDRRPATHFEDKHAASFGDRRMFDDRRFPGYDRRPLLEEVVRTGNAPSVDRPPEALLENEKRQDMKTRVPGLSPHPSAATVAMASENPTTSVVDHRPVSSSSMPMVVDNRATSASLVAAPLGERSSQPSSLLGRVSGTYPQPRLQVEPTRPGLFLEERPNKARGATPSSFPSTNQTTDGLPHARVSESSHTFDLHPGLNDDQERYSLPTDNQTRPVSAAYSRALTAGRDESRVQPPPPPPSSSSAFSSTQSSLPFRVREPSRERQPTFRPYVRSEFSRPLEDNRRPDTNTLQPGDGIRRYDERGRWSPSPYGDRRNYREYYDRDRPYWDNKDRVRDRPAPPPQLQHPPHWDRERTRYSESSFTGVGLDRRFEDRDQGNRDRGYQPSYDNTSRRQFDTFTPRGRPRSSGSPSHDLSELRPPPPKRVRDETYVGSHGTTGDDYFTHPHHLPPPSVATNKEPPPPPPSSVQTPVPIPIPRSTTPLPPRYNRLPLLESYGSSYDGYERDPGRAATGPNYSREGPR